jgi:hypothetical protein
MSQPNRAYIEAMREIRRSSAAQPHKDQHAEGRKGFGKGGRAGVRKTLRQAR